MPAGRRRELAARQPVEILERDGYSRPVVKQQPQERYSLAYHRG